MQMIRRNDHEARIEILPLIDVVFLLLTFFIYSMLVMVHLEVLEIDMVPLAAGKQIKQSQVKALTVDIDPDGALYLNKERMSADMLIEKLKEVGDTDETPPLFLLLSRQASVDRAPVMLDLISRFVTAGFNKYTFVGPPVEGAE